MDMAENDEFSGSSDGDCESEIVEKLPCFKNVNKTMGYLTLDARQAFTWLKQVFSKGLILWHFGRKCHI